MVGRLVGCGEQPIRRSTIPNDDADAADRSPKYTPHTPPPYKHTHPFPKYTPHTRATIQTHAPGSGSGQNVATAFLGYAALARASRSATSSGSRSGAQSTAMRAL